MNVAVQLHDAAERVIPRPRAPESIAETGLEEGFLVELLLKTVYRMGLERTSEMSREIKLPVPLIETLIEICREHKLVETLGQLGASMTAEMRYALTSKGKEWALDALTQSEWIGPAPVTMEDYRAQSEAQSIRNEVLTPEMLERVFSQMTLKPGLMEEIGPAVNSGAAILLYGPPGNGKSSIANAVCAAYQDHIYVPHALVVDKQVIALYDPTVHEAIGGVSENTSGLRRESGFDHRFVAIKRPAVTTGGELTLEMLDLAYNPIARVYEAPMQLKAAGGVFVIDDFGRQRPSPQEVINRLIIPLENGHDYLSLQTGRKFQAPFDTLVCFSTNINPSELVDDAALRRLRYKILVDSPDRDTYIRIFALTAQRFGLKLDEDTLAYVLMELYPNQPGASFQAFHPRFLIDQTLAICTYKGLEPQFNREILKHAWKNLFAQA